MRRLRSNAAIVAGLAFGISLAAQTSPPRSHLWWKEPPGARPYTTDAKKLSLISVRGNRLVNPQGTVVLLRGLSIADPDKVETEGHWSKEFFAKAQEMGAKIIRIPVHPVTWRERSPVAYLKLLDQAVQWCTELGLYINLDWHSIGNLTTGLFQNPMYDTSRQETYPFWRTAAQHFAGHNTVVFYELFNEPTTFNERLGQVSWSECKRIQEDLIAIIRAYNRQAIPLVAGFDWAYDLTPIRLEPIGADGIGYVTHPYANKRSQPWEPKWEEDFGFAAAKYPVVATEFGGFAGPDVSSGTQAAYGPAIMKYLEAKGISWITWCFDPDWVPTLISDWEYKLTPAGEFARQAFAGKFAAR